VAGTRRIRLEPDGAGGLDMICTLFVLMLCLSLVALGVFGTADDDRGLVFVTASGGIADQGDIVDKDGRQMGYGIRGDDGAWSLYSLDGVQLGEMAPRNGGDTPTAKPFAHAPHHDRAPAAKTSL
jgi:hypothetical protein